MNMPSLNGKTALVTGASRGMGRASALALAAAGAQVLVHYGRGAKEADAVVAEIRKGGGRADAIAMDLAAADGAGKLARQARSIIGDRLDILVANAGVSKAATIEEMTVEDFDKLFAVNVRAPYFLVQQLIPVLSEGSSVILVSSLGAHAAVGSLSAYAATKGAIDTLVKYFATALGPRGIRVNAVAPGVIDGEICRYGVRSATGFAYLCDNTVGRFRSSHASSLVPRQEHRDMTDEEFGILELRAVIGVGVDD